MPAVMIEQPVHVEDTASRDQVRAVAEAFARAGFEVEVEPDYGRRALGDLPWVVYVPLAVPISAFFTAFASEAGKDAYAVVKSWVHDVWEARAGAGNGEGSVHLADPDASNLILSNSLPDEALDALRDLDWDELGGGYIVWNAVRREWIDHTRRD
jgi:hypothetical protein